jgi:hypothetical protein
MNKDILEKKFAKRIADNIKNIRQKYIKQKKEEIEEQILIIVYVYGVRGGVFPNQIAEFLGIDRSNIIPYTESLVRKGKIKRKDQQSPYFPIDESYKNPLLEAYLFGESFLPFLKRTKKNLVLTSGFRSMFKELEHSKEVTTIDGKKINIDTQLERLDFTTYRKYYETKFTKDDYLEESLFEFSNRIGAFIIRSMIEAMRDANCTKLSIQSTDIQNAITQAYMNKAISSLMPHLIATFKTFIRRIPEFHNEFYENTDHNEYSWKCTQCDTSAKNSDIDKLDEFVTIHENKTGHEYNEDYIFDDRQFSLKRNERGNLLFNNKITLQLLNSFNNIYPLLGYEFNRIIKNMPNNQESYKQFTELLYKKWERQKQCDHRFGDPVESLHGFESVCSKCGYAKRVKNKKSKV